VVNHYGAFIGAHIQDSAEDSAPWLPKAMISQAPTADVRPSAIPAAGSPTPVSSTLEQIKNSSGLASLFELGAQDVVMAIPWMLDRAGAFNLFHLPERIDNILGLREGGSIIAEATGNKTLNMSSHAISGLASAQRTAAPIQGHTAGTTGGFFSYAGFQHFRTFGGVFTYMTSKWAFACLTLVSPQQIIFTSSIANYSLGHRPQSNACLRFGQTSCSPHMAGSFGSPHLANNAVLIPCTVAATSNPLSDIPRLFSFQIRHPRQEIRLL